MSNSIAACVTVVCLLLTPDASARRWTDSTGKYSVEAEFMDMNDGEVRLRAEVIEVRGSQLSEEDRRHILQSLVLGKAQDSVRTFTDSTAKYSVRAEVVGFHDGKVQLRRVITVPLEKLRLGDREWVNRKLRMWEVGDGPKGKGALGPLLCPQCGSPCFLIGEVEEFLRKMRYVAQSTRGHRCFAGPFSLKKRTSTASHRETQALSEHCFLWYGMIGLAPPFRPRDGPTESRRSQV